MKQAKFALTAVAILAVIGGALAFKANRQSQQFYKLTTTLVGGQQRFICNEPVILERVTTAVGGALTPYASTEGTTTTAACPQARVTING